MTLFAAARPGIRRAAIRPDAGLPVFHKTLLCLAPIAFFFIGVTQTPVLSEGLGEPAFRVVDVHEHLQSSNGVHKLAMAMDHNSLSTVVLVASPLEILGRADGEKAGFTNPEWNNNELLQISRSAPERFLAFATYSPADTHVLQKLKVFIKRGGKGLKLYNGHYLFYDMFHIRLDAPHMMEVYAWCEENHIPIIFHANSRYYWSELTHILDAYPRLTINLPHFCMSLVDLDRICELFDRYENVYSDISLGEGKLAYTSLEYISRYRDLFRTLVLKYKTRFLFGADLVITDDPAKDEQYVTDVLEGYRRFLEQERYTGVRFEEYLESVNMEKTEENLVLNGLHLDRDTLKHIYEINPGKFLGLGP